MALSGITRLFPLPSSLLLFLLYWLFALTLYGASCANVPRRDDHWFMAERAYHPDAGDWWRHTLSFTRSRKLAPGDYFLSRPGVYAVLATLDVFARGRPDWIAHSSFVLIAAAATSLYLATRPVLGNLLAGLLAANLLAQYAGLEIVCWRHISPYLLAVTFLGLGYAAQPGCCLRRPPGWLPACGCWFLACLFHEAVPAGLVIAAGLVALRSLTTRTRSPLWPLLLPVAGYMAWSALEFTICQPPGVLGRHDRASVVLTLSSVAECLKTTFNAFGNAFFSPWTVRLSEYGSGMLAWVFDPQRRSFQRAGGLLAAVLLCVLQNRLRPRSRETGPLSAADLGIGLFVAVWLMLGLGRGLLRGPGYLHQATYYYSLTAYAISLVLTGLMPAGKTAARWVRLAFLVGLGGLTLVNAVRVRQTLEPRRESLTVWNATQIRIQRELVGRHGRLAGIVPGHEAALSGQVDLLVLQNSRWTNPSRTNLYLGSVEGRPTVFTAARITPPRPGEIVALTSASEVDGDRLHLTSEAVEIAEWSVEARGDRVRLVIGCQDPENLVVLAIEQHEAYAQSRRDGVWGPRTNITVIGNQSPARHLRIVRCGDHLALLDGEDVLTSTPAAEVPRGRIGFLTSPTGANRVSPGHLVRGPRDILAFEPAGHSPTRSSASQRRTRSHGAVCSEPSRQREDPELAAGSGLNNSEDVACR